MARKRHEPQVEHLHEPEEALQPLSGLMAPGETVLIRVSPAHRSYVRKYVFTLGLAELARRRENFAVTDRRVLIGKGVFRRSERSIPLSRIDDVSLSRSGISSYVHLTLSTKRPNLEIIGPLNSRKARRFAAEVIGRI